MGSCQSSGSASGNNKSSAAGPSTSLPQVLPVPLEILEEIFLHLPPHQVVGVCRSVCRQWREVADSESLWRERCQREGYRPRDPSKMTKDWRLFYFLCKKRRNLLKNPKAEHGMTDWQILGDGDRWCVEEVTVPHPNETVQKNFVTTYGMCMKSQLIDLEEEGYNPSIMDRFQPEIRIYDWYAPRRDCGSKYEICVTLLNKKKKPVKTFAPKIIYFDSWDSQNWTQITHVFQNYGPGVRYISYTHGGRDKQHWGRWFGIHVTDSCVEICSAMDP